MNWWNGIIIENKWYMNYWTGLLRNLKCKVYEDEVVVQELTKQQQEIFERFGIIVPKNMGI
ncbi:MAG TPA: hypothetical protein EYP80_01680 [Candidatus Aenigmarchaeota archaeon]|nr:hypothetical protein [Candidatus Aenigmarchaeota archaeon]